jgi:hypothetical protein
MLRPTYHLTVPKEDDSKFQLALRTVGIVYNARITNNGMTEADSVVEYVVELSKYELLYVCLASKVTRVVNVNEWKADQTETSQGDVQPDNVEV